MKFKEFKQQVMEISREQFICDGFDPLEFGIQRAYFEEDRLKRLIAVAERSNYLTAKRKISGWQRQLERVRQRRARLESVQKGIFPGEAMASGQATRPAA